MDRKHTKISIIGSGAVGATLAYSIATRKLISELAIIDINSELAEGEAMDISHGLVTMEAMNIHGGDYSEITDSDVIIVTAGIGRKPGDTRLDLAKNNVGIARDIAANLVKYYNGGIVLVVSNPVDIITYVILKESGLPKEKIIGTGTMLDSARFRYLLSERVHVDVRNIHGFMAGEHGDSQFAVWSSVHIAGMTLDSYCAKRGLSIDKDEIEREVIRSGAEVIKRKGATYYAIAALAAELCNTIIKNKKSIYSVSTLLDGDVCLSMPCVIGIGGAEDVIPFDFTPEEEAKLANSKKTIRDFLDMLEL